MPLLAESPAVLVVLMGSLGDVARAMPLVCIIKHHRPACRLSWLVDWRWRDLVAVHPGIDRVITFPRDRTPAAFSTLVRELGAVRPDITLDLQRHLKSGVCSRVSGARRRVGFHRANAKEFNHLFNNEHIACRPAEYSKLRHYLAFAEHLGLPVPEALDFGLSRLAQPELLPEAVRAIRGGFVGLVLGSSWRSKDWTLDGYVSLVLRIRRETPLRVVLLGDPSQQDRAVRVMGAAARPGIVNLVGRTSLLELGATLAAARAVVGPDSGPGHVSAALGTPHVTLFGPTRIERVVPYRCEHLAVRSPLDCTPCGRRRCRRYPSPCMDAIGAERVWHILKPLLA